MEKIIINGNFLCRNLTGIERFALETTSQLDRLLKDDDDISIYVPCNAKVIPSYKKINVIKSKKPLKSFPLWDLFEMKKICKKEKSLPLNYANTSPLGRPYGYTILHDIYAKVFPKDFVSFRDKLMRLYNCFSYWNSAKHTRVLFTVSEFSKQQICTTYKISEDKVFVIPNGWDHFKSIEADNSIFQKYPALKEKNYYFTLGSLSKRKNLKWVAEYAQKHPNEQFAISGKAISGLVPQELSILQNLPNVILLGYVSDEQVKALMSKCSAFIFPSYYEGFGIPPLEALSVGAKIIVSNTASLPEIYKDCAIYINPDDSNIELSELIKQTTASPEKILDYYTYENAAKKLLEKLL